MKQKTLKPILTGLGALVLASGAAQAAVVTVPTISDVDLAALQFDIVTITPDASEPNVVDAEGTTTSEYGTVGWSIGNSYGPLTSTTSTVGFNIGGVVGTPSFEHLHVSGQDMVINFDTAITSILFYVQNDNSGEITGLDLGIAPVDVYGAALPTLTAYSINTGGVGAYLLYQFMAPVTAVYSNYTDITGGFDMAFFANVLPPIADPVPLPAAAWMFIAGIGGVLGARRRKARA